MSVISDILRPYYITGLPDISGVTKSTFKEWIENENQAFDYYDSAKKEYFFSVYNKTSFLQSIAFDISRMSIATFESICDISAQREMPHSTAWPLIRSYYSAFFAAHTFIRIFGYAVIQLEKSQSQKLNSVLQYHDNPIPNLSDGLYLVRFLEESSRFSLQKLNNGSHEDTWNVLAALIEKLSDDFMVDGNPIPEWEKQSVYGKFKLLVDVMRTEPCKSRSNWLSRMRNEINYQHRHGTWYPHEKSKNFRDSVFLNLISWGKEPDITVNAKTHCLDKYSKACAFLVSLVKELICDIEYRNSNNDSFLKVTVMKVLKQAEGRV